MPISLWSGSEHGKITQLRLLRKDFQFLSTNKKPLDSYPGAYRKIYWQIFLTLE